MSVDHEPMREGQRRKAAESGRRLLTATVELIGERGYEATTAAAIGERAGYSREMVRARFGSKAALLDQLFAREFEDRLLASEPGRTGLDSVLRLVDHLEALGEEDPAFLRAMFVLSFEAVHRATELHERIADWLRRLEASLADDFATGVADGSVAAGVVPTEAAQAVLRAGAGMAFCWAALPDRTELPAELARFRRQVLAIAEGALPR